MKIITYIFFLLVLGLSLTACNDPFHNEQLPPATQTGANTFGFKLDGEVWLPYYKGLKFDNNSELLIRYTSVNGGFRIESNRDKDDLRSKFYMTCSGINQNTGNLFDFNEIRSVGDFIYFINSPNDSIRCQLYFRDENFNSSRFLIDINKTNKFFFIKIDTVNKIISGEFEFALRNHEGRLLNITEGRFDFNYPYER